MAKHTAGFATATLIAGPVFGPICYATGCTLCKIYGCVKSEKPIDEKVKDFIKEECQLILGGLAAHWLNVLWGHSGEAITTVALGVYVEGLTEEKVFIYMADALALIKQLWHCVKYAGEKVDAVLEKLRESLSNLESSLGSLNKAITVFVN